MGNFYVKTNGVWKQVNAYQKKDGIYSQLGGNPIGWFKNHKIMGNEAYPFPEGYIRRNYIVKTTASNAYINDIGYRPTHNIRIQLKFKLTNLGSGGAYFIGKNGSGSDLKDCRLIIAKAYDANGVLYFDLPGVGNEPWTVSDKSSQYYSQWGHRCGICFNHTYNGYYFGSDGIHELELGNYESFYIKDIVSGTYLRNATKVPQSDFTNYLNLDGNVFRVYSDNANDCYGRVYYLKIYDGLNLVKYLVPVTKNSNSVNGLYDLVGNVFYPPATGYFNVG